LRREEDSVGKNLRTAALAIGAVAGAGTGTATAATGLIHGSDIAHHTITAKQIKRASLHADDLTATARAKLRGHRGPAGPRGARGPAGKPATFSALPWGVIGRNTIGSPVGQLRVGPGNTPLGIGSLGIEVAGPPSGGTTADAEKLSWGVVGAAFAKETGVSNPGAITSLTYKEYTDIDDSTALPAGIAIEANPDISGISYTTLTYVPPVPSAADHNKWVTVDTSAAPVAGQSGWVASGAAGTSTGCTLSTPCSLADLQSKLGPNASILTFAVVKGRDNAWNGAVDDLEVGSSGSRTIFNFDPLGVTAHTAVA